MIGDPGPPSTIVGSKGFLDDTTIDGSDCKFFANYIYLDYNERRKVFENIHDFLIVQTQKITYKNSIASYTTYNDISLDFVGPIKYLSMGNSSRIYRNRWIWMVTINVCRWRWKILYR